MADDLVDRLRETQEHLRTIKAADGEMDARLSMAMVRTGQAAARIQALDDERLKLLRANYAANRQLAEVTLHRNLEAALAEEREATEGRFMAQVAALQIALAEALRERTEARAEAANLRADLKQAEGRVKAITIAMHDAIRRPMGVVPETAEPFYQPALASDALLDRQGE